MRATIKYLFFAYVIFLAGYVTYTSLLGRSFGKHRVEFVVPEKTCFDSGTGWDYCVYSSPTSDAKSILYVFHGRGETASSWVDSSTFSGLLQKHWQSRTKKTPVVVSISFGSTWLVTKKMSKPSSGIMDRFKKEVFPTVEKKLGRPLRRFLLGYSMGGLNALSVALEMNQHFSRVAALCPPIFKLSPYDGWKKVVTYTVRTGARPRSVMAAVGVGRHYFANTKEWLDFSPLEKIRRTSFKPHQRFYISAGTKDEYGLFEGVQAFVDDLRKTGAITYWHPNSGKHCAVDIQSLADFFAL